MPKYSMVIYHSPCYDGHTAAWIAYQALPKGTIFVPALHGDVPPDVTGHDVLIIDFSYPRDVLLELRAKAKSLTLIDHHISAQRELGNLSFCHFDMTKSGAGLAWDHFHPNQSRPLMINYIEDCDLGQFALTNSREYNAALSTFPMTFDAWSYALAYDINEMISNGRTVIAYKRQCAIALCARARIVNFYGQHCWSINSPQELINEVADVLLNRPDDGGSLQPVLAWSFDHIRNDFYCSLRLQTNSTADISTLASLWGGGGHKHRAGFRLKFLDLFDILNAEVRD